MVHASAFQDWERCGCIKAKQCKFEARLCPVGSLSLNLARYEIEGPDRANQRLVVVAAAVSRPRNPVGFRHHHLGRAAGRARCGCKRHRADAGCGGVPLEFEVSRGPLVDGLRLPGGRRRPWILIAQMGMVGTLAGLSQVGLASPDQLTAWLLAHNVFAALQDVATDALAVDVMPERERGRANGIMYAQNMEARPLEGRDWPSSFNTLAGRSAHLSKRAWWQRLEHSRCFCARTQPRSIGPIHKSTLDQCPRRIAGQTSVLVDTRVVLDDWPPLPPS